MDYIDKANLDAAIKYAMIKHRETKDFIQSCKTAGKEYNIAWYTIVKTIAERRKDANPRTARLRFKKEKNDES